MNDWLQAHQRFASILLESCPATDIDPSDKSRLKSILTKLSEVASTGSSCLDLDEDSLTLLNQLQSYLPWLAQSHYEAGRNKAVFLIGPRLYLNKYFHAERDIELALKSRTAKEATIDDHTIIQKIRPLEYMTPAGETVILNTLRHNLSIITGGPGTGKTTIVVRVLALLIEQFRKSGKENVEIKILAPTGKAAARVKESVVSQKNRWVADLRGFEMGIIQSIPEVAQTAHQFLGINPNTRKSRYRNDQKAHVDIVVVDEASMLDVLLVRELLAALHQDTKLILLGDPHQLASVEAGNVLAQIVAAGQLPANDWLKPCCTELTESHRFPKESGIGQLAEATKSGDADSAMRLLNDTDKPDVQIGRLDDSYQMAAEGYRSYKHAVENAQKQLLKDELGEEQIDEVFKAFEQWQVFSPFRLGVHGVEGLNLNIEESLGLKGGGDWYFGKPVLIGSNDYSLKLLNGDIGICLDPAGKTVCFPATDLTAGNQSSRYRYVNTRVLPEHQLVYAMTVHKSQGSEYGRCMLVVPEPNVNQKNLLKREILYTAITRAKKGFFLFAGEVEVRLMVETKTERMSGLLLS